MKVLLVAPHYPPRFVGGVELATQRLAQRLHEAGHEAAVMAVEALGVDDAPDGIRVAADDDAGVSVWRLSVARPPAAERLLHAYRPPGVERWLTAWLARERPDVVHLHSGYLLGGAVLSACAAQGVPVVVTLHDFWFICPRVTLLHPNETCCTGPETPAKCAWCLATERRRYRVPERWLGERLSRRAAAWLAQPALTAVSELPEGTQAITDRRRHLLTALAGAAAVLSPSRFVRDELGRAGFDAERITLLPYGVEPRRPAPRRPADALALRLAFIGQVAPHKGVHVLIEAIRRSPHANIECVIHGHLTREVDYVRDLRARTAGDPRIVFAGPIAHAELDAFFQRVDVLAVPSVWYENSPFVIHEARFAGLPVLASRLGGMVELVRDDVDGLLAEAGSPDAFAHQIDRLVTEPGLIDRLRAEVRRPPTLDEEVEALIGIYRRVARQETAAS